MRVCREAGVGVRCQDHKLKGQRSEPTSNTSPHHITPHPSHLNLPYSGQPVGGASYGDSRDHQRKGQSHNLGSQSNNLVSKSHRLGRRLGRVSLGLLDFF